MEPQDPAVPNGALDTGNRLRRWQSYRMDYDAAGNMTVKRTLSAIDTTKVLRRDSLFWSALGRLDSVRTRDSVGTLTGRVVSGMTLGDGGCASRPPVARVATCGTMNP